MQTNLSVKQALRLIFFTYSTILLLTVNVNSIYYNTSLKT